MPKQWTTFHLEEDKRLQYPLFHLATVVGAHTTMKKLKDRGVNENERVKGASAIQLAVKYHYWDSTLRLLVQLGAELNNPEDALLHTAVKDDCSCFHQFSHHLN